MNWDNRTTAIRMAQKMVTSFDSDYFKISPFQGGDQFSTTDTG